ncbi:MAG: DUF350 domain-containing protein [Paraclostridium sp.]
MENILGTITYSAIGFVLMLVGNFLVDLVIPCHFPTEIKKGNNAVGCISAASSIAIGILLRSVIASPVTESIGTTLLQDLTSTIIYFTLGIVLCILGYLSMLVFNKQYNLNEEIGNGNTAAGLMVAGIFIGLAVLISGAIQ